MALIDDDPLVRVTWTDRETGVRGYLVVHTLVSGLATGGTRMRAGCTLSEVEDLARGMAIKAAVFDLPVGGAKGGIDCDPKDPRARGVLRRFVQAMRPWLDDHWVTAEDLGVPQHVIDEIFGELGLDQSYHAAIHRSVNPALTLRRVRAGLNSPVPGGYLLGDVVGGYGVAQSCLGVAAARGWRTSETTVAVQGVGTMGGGAAWYLHEAGLRIVMVADAAGALYDPAGLDIPALLAARDRFGEIDRSRVPERVARLPKESVLSVEVDLLVPAAVSYAITEQNADAVAAGVVVEAANVATTPAAERRLAERGVPVMPDFVVNAGAAAWAWWLLLGRVDADPALSFSVLRQEMLARIAPLVSAWDHGAVPPRTTALAAADLQVERHRAAEADGRRLVTIP
ncbi:Glu/Leu/Phe/Val dehydrogenase dimerization domain-containing protein [Actinoalloteichus hymeniacidonis]|uniref:Glutamate dehydrogenase n=1 Tax=Actinoalloteichus hymeniacidonis TaxID=340345 RepID=A0AAC9HN55_9PSEU|nr:Glu/Leu/Phe/Val dehydrogenase dimerization domain-containing protein [Actinoalloteichus hymeniacidonis]AOS62257.1 glutamate dehydrogenase/leucine dehydrogenase [Actinoalloteichus hymeniacidonis]MBB5909717.1 glutamate dehydrogenase (NAD(P)+) [Actinoalloteichus hymeniacidonis]